MLTGKYPHKVTFTNSKHNETYKKEQKEKKTFINDYFSGGGKNKNENRKKRRGDKDDGGDVKRAKIENVTPGSSRIEHDLSDDEAEEERVKALERQLEMMKQSLKHKETSNGASNEVEQDERRVEVRRGTPTCESTWEEQGTLLMHTSKGVEARHKVSRLFY